MKPNTKNKLTLLLIAVLFFTPVIVAIVLNSSLVEFHPESFKNKGTLIKPPVKITSDEFLKDFEEYWTLVYNHNGSCEKECMEMLKTIYTIRLTKGHKMKRIKLLILTPETDEITFPEEFSTIEKANYPADGELAKTLAELSKQSFADGNGLYILAPEGFLMMAYAKDFKPDDVMDDLGLLLRARKNEG